jgi:hypothetical protein
VRDGTDRDLIREATTELNRMTARLADAMMDAALRRALGHVGAEGTEEPS